MMKMLKIPEERWERIATGVLKEEQAERHTSLLTPDEKLLLPKKVKNNETTPPVEFSDEMLRFDDDDPFEDFDSGDLCNRFKVLHHQLLKDRKRENTKKLIDILDTLLKRDLINISGYKKAFDKVMDDQTKCTQ